MSNILVNRIKKVKLTKQQQKIANYFIKNIEKLGSLSSLEVANEIGVSDASIIRFSRLIGFEGYADLKEQVYDMIVEDAFATLSLSERLTKSRKEYPEEDLYNNFIDLISSNIKKTFTSNNRETFDRIASTLINANHKYIVGLRGCKGVCTQFTRILSFILPHTDSIIDSECTSINAIQDINEDDVLFMFVLARYYKIDIDYLKLAKKRGAKICLVTDSPISIVSGYADEILVAETKHLSFFNSLISISAIAEYLLTLIERQVDFNDRIEERDEITEILRI